MKWKGNDRFHFLLPCHNKHKKIFFLFSLSMKKEESLCTCRIQRTSLLACRLLDVARFTTPTACLQLLAEILGSEPMPFSLRSLPPLFFLHWIFPCRFFFLQARLEAYICKYPRGIMNQRLTPDAFRQEWLQEREAGELPGQESFPDERCKLS